MPYKTTATRLGLVFAFTLAFGSGIPEQAQGQQIASNESQKNEAPSRKPDLEEIVVSETYEEATLEQTRFSESVIDILGSEDFAVTGDSNVVDALARISGVTVVDNKFVYVRGLGERYSTTLFNNALLPSPDPARRVVPLDLFPSGVMKQLAIQKTYSPNLPGDFSGGVVSMTAREVPAQRELKLSLSTSYNSEATFRSANWVGGDNLDWTGFEGGFRDLPSLVNDLSIDGRLPPTALLTPEQIESLGKSLDRSFDLDDDMTIRPDFGLNATYGDSRETPSGYAGWLVGLRAGNRWTHIRENRRTSQLLPGGGTEVRDDFSQVRTENNITYSALASGELGFGPYHWLQANLFYTRVTDKRFIEDKGFLRENGRTVERTTLEWEERALWTLQLAGNHYLRNWADLAVDWGATFANAERIKPDTRFYEYEQTVLGDFVFADERSGNLRQWEDLSDDAWDLFVNADLPVAFHRSLFTTFKTGLKFFRKDRDSSLRKLRYNAAFQSANDFNRVRRQDIEGVFSNDNIGRRKWELEESTQFTDSYTASEEIRAVYLQADNEIGDSLRLLLGARYEESEQGTATRAVSGGSPVVSNLTGGFLLPAITATWSFRENHQLRLAWSQTINRPDIREISPAPYLDPETRFEYIGNPDIQIAEIDNYDLRWEWYFRAQDSLQLALFYKEIAQPIEETLLLKGSSVQRTYQNAEGAELYGLEFALQQDLGFLGNLARDFSYKLNGTLISSDVAVDPDAINQTNASRSLQGQSDWVVNGQLVYDNLVLDSQLSLAFNMFGERIFDVGVNGLDDSFEQSVPILDFNYRQGFELMGAPMNAQFKIRNILDPSYEITRGEVVEREFNRGRTFQLMIEREF